jgi:hypothetical protein
VRGGDWFIAVVEPDGNGSGGISLNGGRQLSAYQLISGDDGGGGRGAFISGVRLLEWAFLTPVMLLVVKQLQQSAVVPPVHRYTDAFQHIQTSSNAIHRRASTGSMPLQTQSQPFGQVPVLERTSTRIYVNIRLGIRGGRRKRSTITIHGKIPEGHQRPTK